MAVFQALCTLVLLGLLAGVLSGVGIYAVHGVLRLDTVVIPVWILCMIGGMVLAVAVFG